MATRASVPGDAGGDDSAAVSLVSFVVDAIVDGVMKGRYAQGQRLATRTIGVHYPIPRTDPTT